MREPVELLLEKFIAFGKARNAPIYSGTAANETIFRVFRKASIKLGLKLEKLDWIEFMGRKA